MFKNIAHGVQISCHIKTIVRKFCARLRKLKVLFGRAKGIKFRVQMASRTMIFLMVSRSFLFKLIFHMAVIVLSSL